MTDHDHAPDVVPEVVYADFEVWWKNTDLPHSHYNRIPGSRIDGNSYLVLSTDNRTYIINLAETLCVMSSPSESQDAPGA